MTELIELATGKLNDPILMDWAIDRYRQARKGDSQRRETMGRTWFDDLTLRRWLNSGDQETVSRLVVHLPEERFANLGQALGERWSKWGGSLAYHSAPVLARYQPDLAWRCFAEPPGGRHRDIESILVVIRSLVSTGAECAGDTFLLEPLEQHLPRQQRLFDDSFYQLARLLEVAQP